MNEDQISLTVDFNKEIAEDVGNNAWILSHKKNNKKNRRIKSTNVFRMLRGAKHDTLVLSGANTLSFAKSVLVSPTASILISINLTALGIVNAEIFESCINLQSCYLSQNKIENIPIAIIKLRHLRILDISNNLLYDLNSLKNIEHSSTSLIALNLQDNTVSQDKNYREYIVNRLPNLMSLDGVIVSPWEFHPLLYKYYKPLQVPEEFISFREGKSGGGVIRMINIQVKFISFIRDRALNHVTVLSKYTKRFCERKRIKDVTPAATLLQAVWRGRSVRNHLRRKLCRILKMNNWLEEDYAYVFEENVSRAKERKDFFIRRIQTFVREWLEWKRQNDAALQIQDFLRFHMASWDVALRRNDKFKVKSLIFGANIEEDIIYYINYLKANGYEFPDLNIDTSNHMIVYESVQTSQSGTRINHLFLSDSKRKRLRIVPELWNNYVDKVERHRLKTFKQQGCYLTAVESLQVEVKRNFKQHRTNFRQKCHFVKFVSSSNIESIQMLSCMVCKHLMRVNLSLRPFLPRWDKSVVLEIAVVEVQKMWRGYTIRRLSIPRVVMILIKTRAAKRLQRWCRTYLGIRRRFSLLKRMSCLIRDISTPTLYIDAWVFYSLIRIQDVPNLSKTASLYPEFKGYPSVDGNGDSIFMLEQPTETDNLERKGFSKWLQSIPSHYNRSNSDINGRSVPKRSLYSTLLNGAKVTLKYVKPEDEFSKDHLDQAYLRIIELTYKSCHEAKARMLSVMNLTYDSSEQSSIELMNETRLLQTIDAKYKHIVHNFYKGLNQEHEIDKKSNISLSPCEYRVNIMKLPRWLNAHIHETKIQNENKYNDNDIPRFRFLLETLALDSAHRSKLVKAKSEGVHFEKTSSNNKDGIGMAVKISSPREPPPSKGSHISMVAKISGREMKVVSYNSDDVLLEYRDKYTNNNNNNNNIKDDSFNYTDTYKFDLSGLLQHQNINELDTLLSPKSSILKSKPKRNRILDFEASDAISKKNCFRNLWSTEKIIRWISLTDLEEAHYKPDAGVDNDALIEYSQTLLTNTTSTKNNSNYAAVANRLHSFQVAKEIANNSAIRNERDEFNKELKEQVRQHDDEWRIQFNALDGERNFFLDNDLILNERLTSKDKWKVQRTRDASTMKSISETFKQMIEIRHNENSKVRKERFEQKNMDRKSSSAVQRNSAIYSKKKYFQKDAEVEVEVEGVVTQANHGEDGLQSTPVVPTLPTQQRQQQKQQESQQKDQHKYVRKAKKNMAKNRMKSAIKSEIRSFGRNRGNILSVLARKLEAAGSDTIRAANLAENNKISKSARRRVEEEHSSIQLELSQITEDNHQHHVHHVPNAIYEDTKIKQENQKPQQQRLYEQQLQQQQQGLGRTTPTSSENKSPRYEESNNIHLVIPTHGPDITDSPMITPIPGARRPRPNNVVKHYMETQQILRNGMDIDTQIPHVSLDMNMDDNDDDSSINMSTRNDDKSTTVVLD